MYILVQAVHKISRILWALCYLIDPCLFFQAETVTMIRPLLPKMTLSELHTVMTNGFATVAGSTLATYILYGVSLAYILYGVSLVYILYGVCIVNFLYGVSLVYIYIGLYGVSLTKFLYRISLVYILYGFIWGKFGLHFIWVYMG